MLLGFKKSAAQSALSRCGGVRAGRQGEEAMAIRMKALSGVSLIALLAIAASLPVAAPAQAATNIERLLGGPKGAVKSDQGVALEGIGIQLVSDKTAIRTTVYSNA